MKFKETYLKFVPFLQRRLRQVRIFFHKVWIYYKGWVSGSQSQNSKPVLLTADKCYLLQFSQRASPKVDKTSYSRQNFVLPILFNIPQIPLHRKDYVYIILLGCLIAGSVLPIFWGESGEKGICIHYMPAMCQALC